MALWLHLINTIRRKEHPFLPSPMLLMGEAEFFGISVYVYRVTRSRHILKNNREKLLRYFYRVEEISINPDRFRVSLKRKLKSQIFGLINKKL